MAKAVHPPAVPAVPLAPTVPTTALLGHMGALRDDPLRTFVEAHEQYGDVVRLRAAHVYLMSIRGVDAMQRMLVTNASNYVKGTRGLRKMRLALGDGLVTADGASWKRHRRIANPAFHRTVLARFAEQMVQAAEDRVEDWTDGETIDVAEQMGHLTLRIAGEAFFGDNFDNDEQVVSASLEAILRGVVGFATTPLPWPERLPTPTARRFHQAVADLDAVVGRRIAKRRAEPLAEPDLLGMLMDAADDADSLTDKELRDEAVTLLLAGHETTANALSWTFHLLGLHPWAAERICAEVEAIAPGRPLAFEDLRALQWTRQVFLESMRLFPPMALIGRQAVKDDMLGGYHVSAGTIVYLPIWAVHHDPKWWDAPECFDPDRFAPEVRPRHKLAYLPFTAGSRKCIGDRFAEMEGVLALATMLRRVSLEGTAPVEPEELVTLRPKGGLPMRVARR